jgi:hypothetical protein
MYASALLLALIVAVLILLPWFYGKLNNTGFRESLLFISGAVMVLSVLDFSAANVFFAPWSGSNGLFLCVVSLAVWVRYSFSREANKRQKWKRIRPPLILFFVPFLLLAWWFGFEHLMLPGLIVYFTGVNLLFLALIQIQYRCTTLPYGLGARAVSYSSIGGEKQLGDKHSATSGR